MKNVFLCLLFAPVSVFANSENPPPKLNFVIDSARVDTSISTTQSVIEIRFLRNNTVPVSEAIKMSRNGEELVANPDINGIARLQLVPGKYRFMFFYNTAYYEIKTDSVMLHPRYRMFVSVSFTLAQSLVRPAKPVIYIYPEKTTTVEVKLDVKGKLGFTYPQYNSGWNVIADPDGTLHKDDKQYDYLFWDGETMINNADPEMKTGFIVQQDSLVPFFENKLSAMGLSPREAQDFITYWCPLMAVNKTNFVHFEFTIRYDQFAEIAITPKPDNLFRVMMVWSACDGTTMVKPQQIERANRSGFTVIEWGGAEAPELFNLFTTTN